MKFPKIIFTKIISFLLLVTIITSGILIRPKITKAGACDDFTNEIAQLALDGVMSLFAGETKLAIKSAADKLKNIMAVPTYDATSKDAINRVEQTSQEHKELDRGERMSNALLGLSKCIAGIAAKRLLDSMVDQIINWIQGEGEPQFVTNWEEFAKDAANQAGGEVAQAVGLGFLCTNFDLNVRLALEEPPEFSKRSACTVDQIVGNVESFYNNFLDGGWIAYNEVWLPNNNYYGTLLMAHQERSVLAAQKVNAAINEAIAGGGYLGVKNKIIKDGINETKQGISDMFKEDPDTGLGTDEEKERAEHAEQLKNKLKARKAQLEFERGRRTGDVDDITLAEEDAELAQIEKEITTPGNTVGSIQNRALQSDFNILENVISADAVATYINAIADAALNRLIKEGVDGLKGLSTKNAPSRGFIGAADICGRLQGDERITCLGTQDFSALSVNDKKTLLEDEIKKETDDLNNVITTASSSKVVLAQTTSTLNSLLTCNPQTAPTVAEKLAAVASQESTLREITNTSEFLLGDIQRLNADLAATPLNNAALIEIKQKFGAYQTNKSQLRGVATTEGINAQKDLFELDLRRAQQDLTQCQTSSAP